MKSKLIVLPAVLSTLLIAAHFFRYQQYLAVALILVSPFLLLFKRSWSFRLYQGLLLLSSIEWFRTLNKLVQFRIEMGLPYMRLAIILSCVSLFTLFSAILLNKKGFLQKFTNTHHT
jgi:hypothetical protein